mgnify:CR=1 FL=1
MTELWTRPSAGWCCLHPAGASFAFLSTRSDAWAKPSFPAGRSTRGVFVHCVQQYEVHHRGEIYLMLGLMGMEAPDV